MTEPELPQLPLAQRASLEVLMPSPSGDPMASVPANILVNPEIQFPHQGHVTMAAPGPAAEEPVYKVVWCDGHQTLFRADRFARNADDTEYVFTRGGKVVASVPVTGVRYVRAPLHEGGKYTSE